MENNDLDMVIAEAEGWIERLKALRVKHEAPTVRGIPFEDGSPCPNHGNSYCLHCNWPPRKAAPTTGYTAVDMTTAAAQGFRDGRNDLHEVANDLADLLDETIAWIGNKDKAEKAERLLANARVVLLKAVLQVAE